MYEDNEPFFVPVRKVKKYLSYAGDNEWPAETLPTILLIVENKSIHKRLRKRIAKELRNSYEQVTFMTTILEYLLNPAYKGKVWFPIDEDGDVPDDPIEAVALINKDMPD